MKRDMDIFFGLTPEDTGMAKVGNLWWSGDVVVTVKRLLVQGRLEETTSYAIFLGV
ncbi:MAG: hypothetical protein IPM82_19775 [Saprospiraceae bacterium]|nr:hypothetical protein [Saprospiraceae bacterium]